MLKNPLTGGIKIILTETTPAMIWTKKLFSRKIKPDLAFVHL